MNNTIKKDAVFQILEKHANRLDGISVEEYGPLAPTTKEQAVDVFRSVDKAMGEIAARDDRRLRWVLLADPIEPSGAATPAIEVPDDIAWAMATAVQIMYAEATPEEVPSENRVALARNAIFGGAFSDIQWTDTRF